MVDYVKRRTRRFHEGKGFIASLSSDEFADPLSLSPEELLIGREEEGLEDSEAEGVDGRALRNRASTVRTLKRFCHRLPPRDADQLALYYEQGLRQLQIASIFGVTQAAISHSLRKAVKRLQWLATVPELTYDGVCRDLWEFTPQQRTLLWGLYRTTSQVATGREMGLTQTQVGHKFRVAFRRLQRLDAAWKALDAKKLQEAHLRFLSASETQRRAGTTPLFPLSENPKRFEPYLAFFGSLRDRKWSILQLTSIKGVNDEMDTAVIITVADRERNRRGGA